MLLTSSRIGKRFAAEAACKGRFATVTDTDVHVAHVSIVEGLRTLAALVILDPTVPEHVHLQVVGHAESLTALVAYKIRRFSPQLGTSYEVPLFFRLGVGSAPWFLFTDCGFSDPGLLCNWCLFFGSIVTRILVYQFLENLGAKSHTKWILCGGLPGFCSWF